MEDKIKKFLELTSKKVSLKRLCQELDEDPLGIYGLKNRAEKEGYDIAYELVDDEITFYNLGENKDHRIQDVSFISDDGHFKCMVISSSLIGNKAQQLSIIKDIYKKAKEEGIKHIFLCGDLVSGKYSMTSSFHDSNFLTDIESQIDYFISHFPKEDGIKTYFITGRKDQDKKISVGSRIAESRDDMVYIGNCNADIKLDNSTIKLLNSPLSKTYTISYRPQQFANSFRAEDKPDLLLIGGLCQVDSINFRGINVFSIPSLCGTTDEMTSKRYENTVGAVMLDIKTNKKGKIEGKESIKYTILPYYQTDKNDYKKHNNSSAQYTNPTEDTKVPEVDANRYYKWIHNGASVEEFKAEHHFSDLELDGILEVCNLNGNDVKKVVNAAGDLVFLKPTISRKVIEKLPKDSQYIKVANIGLVSDTHIGNRENQLHSLYDFYNEAARRGIKDIYHGGDISDGFYNIPTRITYPEQTPFKTFDAQGLYILKAYPYKRGIVTHLITGNHDLSHIRNGGANIGNWLEASRKDIEYLGHNEATVLIDDVLKLGLRHPIDGSSKSFSYKVQNKIENMPSGDKENILAYAHYHKYYYSMIRNTHTFMLPAFCAATQFERDAGLLNYVGGVFLTVYYDSRNGNVIYLEAEPRLYDKKDYWEEFGKDEAKVRKLVDKNAHRLGMR